MRAILTLTALGLIAACSSGEKDMTQREQIGQTWKYEGGGTGGKAKVAYIGSANTVQTITAPDTFSVMLVQPMANGEKDVTVKLVGAPFRCDLSDCAVTAVTDDGKEHRWKGRMADTNDGIEIMPSQNAYEAIAKAKMVKVNLAVGKDDRTFPFQFNVEGLDLKS
ncbi:hypothetical protein FHS51_002330 [Sphingobium wenxiniae]|uniref:Uncharacterized protein n=2 Tax=Sphingobium TaxID=165695 RepID=T0HXW9_9SPHN|nr:MULTISPECIES: hypothetical protein [Sphingobium]EQB02374.1 hypothetical protein L485_07635 [Sphingobium baderi LL03]KMS60700.1 hypothetical protein V475_18485 [Sphingobium baderi LL03]MBB6192098.1 hypothetical protein [Sphingobium wenxiniae]TWH92476.1 hypothetical protein IQ35_02592 [Sphingobium wenxiniae]WRD75974.1 hypothetical protein QQ987_14515 [Sphingobium baderi]